MQTEQEKRRERYATGRRRTGEHTSQQASKTTKQRNNQAASSGVPAGSVAIYRRTLPCVTHLTLFFFTRCLRLILDETKLFPRADYANFFMAYPPQRLQHATCNVDRATWNVLGPVPTTDSRAGRREGSSEGGHGADRRGVAAESLPGLEHACTLPLCPPGRDRTGRRGDELSRHCGACGARRKKKENKGADVSCHRTARSSSSAAAYVSGGFAGKAVAAEEAEEETEETEERQFSSVRCCLQHEFFFFFFTSGHPEREKRGTKGIRGVERPGRGCSLLQLSRRGDSLHHVFKKVSQCGNTDVSTSGGFGWHPVARRPCGACTPLCRSVARQA